MNLELTLLELNDLYYAVSKHREKCETEYKEYGKNLSSITYFSAQLDRAKKLEKKVQTTLYDEAKKLDDAIEYVRNYKVTNEEADEDAKQTRDYSRFAEYADSMNEAQSEDRKLGNI